MRQRPRRPVELPKAAEALLVSARNLDTIAGDDLRILHAWLSLLDDTNTVYDTLNADLYEPGGRLKRWDRLNTRFSELGLSPFL
jgi:hypothetical protein